MLAEARSYTWPFWRYRLIQALDFTNVLGTFKSWRFKFSNRASIVLANLLRCPHRCCAHTAPMNGSTLHGGARKRALERTCIRLTFVVIQDNFTWCSYVFTAALN